MQPEKYKLGLDRCLFLGMALQPKVAGMYRKRLEADPGLLHNSTLCSERSSVQHSQDASCVIIYHWHKSFAVLLQLTSAFLAVSWAAKVVWLIQDEGGGVYSVSSPERCSVC